MMDAVVGVSSSVSVPVFIDQVVVGAVPQVPS
jgi:hypothetical protein